VRLAIRDESTSGRVAHEIVIDDVPETLSLRELIRLRVRDEVAKFNAHPTERFAGLVSPEGAEADLNGYRLTAARTIDWELQADAAVDAFEHNGFFVLIGGRQVEDLDEPVRLDEATDVAFVRLVPLVGG
jgi:hypothetical protein